MLQIIAGRSGSGKSEWIHREICRNAEDKEVVLLIPEQSSYYTEKRILETLGPKKAAKVRVLSFKRLYDAVTDIYGISSGKRLDDGSKAVLMSMAAEEMSDRLTLYGSRSKRSDFAQMMLTAVNEYKMCAIFPEDLLKAAQQVKNTRLQQKLRESAAVYASYQALLGSTYSDPDDDLVRLAALLREHQYFSGKTVYIDAFHGFSGQETKIIEELLRQSAYVGITLCCEKTPAKKVETSIFKESLVTLNRLSQIADELGIDQAPVIWLDEQPRYKSPSIAAIEASLFRFDGDCYDLHDGTVQLYEADDEYDEICQTARGICSLVRSEGYSYRDITVVCRNSDMYKNIIASEYPKYGIPFFLSEPQPLSDKPLLKLILSAFEVIHSSFATESILSLLKTGLTPLSDNDVFILENYAYMWEIKGKRWKQPFTMNPDGNKKETNQKRLDYIEALRKAIIEPLTGFGNSVSRAGNGGEITLAVYKLLEELKVSKGMKSFVASLDGVLSIRQRENEARVWDTVMELLDKMYTILRNTSLNSRRYTELLTMMVNRSPISDIPQTLDQVTVGIAGNLRSEAQKAVFLIGALDGIIPAVPASGGLFSDGERASLISLELPLYDSVYGMSLKEKFNAYAALSLPSERLYISRYLSNSKGEVCEPSVIFKEINAILGEQPVRNHSMLTEEELFFTGEQSFEECAALYRDNTVLSATLKEYFSSDDSLSDKWEALVRAADEPLFRINEKGRAKRLFASEASDGSGSAVLRLSASQIEEYYKCPFRYFCRYGLRAFPREKASMDARLYGNTVHYILENLIRETDFEELKQMSDDRLSELIRKYTERYLEEIGGKQDRTSRFLAQFDRIEKNLMLLLKRLIDEFKLSSFVPVDFELTIDNGGEIPAYELPLPDGGKLSVIGKVDRVDTYIHNGKKYIRIIDYKTGPKKFRLSDVLWGLNLQMLLYLSVIEKNGREHYSESNYQLLPAGILYMPSTPETSAGANRTEEIKNELLDKQRSSLKMNGLVIDDKDIVLAMEHNAGGLFLPVKLKKTAEFDRCTESLVSLEGYGRIFRFIDKKLKEMADSLLSGGIDRKPIKGAHDGCDYCDYRTVCGYEDGKASRHVCNYDIKSSLELMGKEDENEQS